MRKKLTLEAVRADPYGFTYKEYAEVMGEAEARRAFASLYRRKVAPASQTLTVKTVYRGGDTDKYVFELPDGNVSKPSALKGVTAQRSVSAHKLAALSTVCSANPGKTALSAI